MRNKTFSEIIREGKDLEQVVGDRPIMNLRVLSNITTNQLGPIMEYSLRSEGVNARVAIGEYDNIIQESTALERSVVPLIFWELSNIIDSFPFILEQEDDDFFQRYLDKMKHEIDLVFTNLRQSSFVLFNKFSHLSHTVNQLRPGRFQIFTNQLNAHLEDNAPANFLLVEIDKPLAQTSLFKAFDWRGFYSSKSLYSVDFFKDYCNYVRPAFLSLYGKSRKAMILDCDNTLWKGIVGEDGPQGIALSDKDKGGKYFKEIHYMVKALSKKGVVIGLCSKNNAADVNEVFEIRPDFLLKKEDILISKVNWEDKATNLSEMAKSLNIGVDSFVFVDDSSFELNLIRDRLPEVKTVAVPERLYDYPQLILEQLKLFFSINESAEDLNRVLMYKQNEERESAKSQASNIEDYLASLDISVTFSNKDKESFERLVQLTQKTNQFNLTTKRYATGDMDYFYNSPEYDVISLEVADKFGNFGITGLCIIKYFEKTATIDTLLMSCRVLGRKVENVFLSEVINRAKQKGNQWLFATYKATRKNSQVNELYDKHGFTMIASNEEEKNYQMELVEGVTENKVEYIKTSWKSE